MTHLSPEELIDAMDGVLAPARRAHLDTCDRCRSETAALRMAESEVRAGEIPEPSPLFWDLFSARVRTAIGEEATRPVRRWFQWPVLAPVATLTLLVVALVSAVSLSRSTAVDPTLADAESAVELTADARDDEWALVAELVGELDIDAAYEAGIATHPGAADAAALQLSLGEQQELIRLLREELRAGG